MVKYLILELIISSIVSIPGLDINITGRMLDGTYVYALDSILNAMSLSKCYLMIRLYNHYSMYLRMI